MGDVSAHFSRSEFACLCGCGFDTVDTELLTMLEIIRQHFDVPIKITSGCRCVSHNEQIGGSANSQHLKGRAADIQVKGVSPDEVSAYFDSLWGDRYGKGSYNTFTHVDSREVRARWAG